MKKVKTRHILYGVLIGLAFMGSRCSSDEEFKPELGNKYGGGIIFYIDASGEHGLIAAPTDQSTGAMWGCKGVYISDSGTTGTYTAVGGVKTIPKPLSLIAPPAELPPSYVMTSH